MLSPYFFPHGLTLTLTHWNTGTYKDPLWHKQTVTLVWLEEGSKSINQKAYWNYSCSLKADSKILSRVASSYPTKVSQQIFQALLSEISKQCVLLMECQ